MEVQIAFTFNASELAGKELVTYEELYDLSNPDEPKKVTEHKDIDDKGQTVTVNKKPEVPEEPTPETPHTPSDSPKTGDRTNVGLFMGLFALSSVGLAGTLYLKKRKTKKS